MIRKKQELYGMLQEAGEGGLRGATSSHFDREIPLEFDDGVDLLKVARGPDDEPSDVKIELSAINQEQPSPLLNERSPMLNKPTATPAGVGQSETNETFAQYQLSSVKK